MKLRSAAIKLYSCVFGRTTGLISDRTYTRTLYYLSFGCLPNLEQPKKFSEHICAIKLSDDTLAYRKYADKYEVRRFVARELGESYLIPMLGVYKSPKSFNPHKFRITFRPSVTAAELYGIDAVFSG